MSGAVGCDKEMLHQGSNVPSYLCARERGTVDAWRRQNPIVEKRISYGITYVDFYIAARNSQMTQIPRKVVLSYRGLNPGA